MNLRISICATALLALAATGLSQSLEVGVKAPPIKVAKWIKGKPVTNLGDGKVRVVEFWATWCGPCKVSIPHLTEVAKKFKGKAEVVGVSVWEVGEGEKKPNYMADVEKFVKTMGSEMDYVVAADGTDNTMAKTWMEAAGQDGIPTAFIIGKDGKVAWIGHPMMGLEEALGQVVAGKFDAKAYQDKQKKEEADREKLAAKFLPIQQAMAQNDEKTAVELLDKILVEDPSLERAYGSLKFELLLVADEPKAYEYAKKLADGLYKDESMLLNNMAWAIVDDAQGLKKPDYVLALSLAERAVSLSKNKDSYSMDTLAYAYFKNGKIDKAIELQTKALALAEKDKNVEKQTITDMKDRLDRFKKRKAAGAGAAG